MQSKKGFEGQVHACWTHKLTSKELDAIRSAGFLISVIHGRLLLSLSPSHEYLNVQQESNLLYIISIGTMLLPNYITQENLQRSFNPLQEW